MELLDVYVRRKKVNSSRELATTQKPMRMLLESTGIRSDSADGVRCSFW